MIQAFGARTRWTTAGAMLAMFIAGHSGPAWGDTHCKPAYAQDLLAGLAYGQHRAGEHVQRNRYRHPVETLTFFGIDPSMTVVEVSPGGSGWYTEILAPFLKGCGRYYGASYDPDSEVEYQRRNAARFQQKLESDAARYGEAVVTVFAPPERLDIAPPGSADLVLTFRNVHGWIEDGVAADVFAAMHRALKPGGVLGLVQHRGDPRAPQDPEARTGYVRQDVVVQLAETAGFRLVSSSEINANPADDRDHPEGVWTLPPRLRLEDQDRETYLAIGESDRMTLKFEKTGRGGQR